MLSEAKTLYTQFGINTYKKIPILMADQSEETNRTRIEHLSFSAITTGSKYIAIISARLGCKLIVHANQSSTPIDRRVHSNCYFPFGSRKSGNKMSVYFRWNADGKILMNPLRTIGIPRPQITSTRHRVFYIFNSIIGTSDIAYRGTMWHDAAKI